MKAFLISFYTENDLFQDQQLRLVYANTLEAALEKLRCVLGMEILSYKSLTIE
ncbi:MAG: hypothetical protein IPP05_22305 [Cytophagaceae bacterium]|nr:hypothetical protein [Cytophagaceae bacterium]